MAETTDQLERELAPKLTGSSGTQAGSGEYPKLGTFGGVFTPTLLTVLGVLLYLRTGWLVGNAGVLGTLLIMLLSFSIAALTTLSLSSIVTNIRSGAAGPYAIIAQALGLEVGGSVGIPHFLAKSLAVTLYLFGVREGWLHLFPRHPALLVDVVLFALLFGIAYWSTHIAIWVEYAIIVVIVGSLVSAGVAAAQGSMQYPLEHVGLWGEFPGTPESGFTGTSFWSVFAVFFPAFTGITAGANMSGRLRDPRRSIPRGTVAAVGVSLAVYLLLAYWLARSATVDELASNYYVMIDKAAWAPIVVAGLLGAAFSSALVSFIGAARILQSLADHDVLPRAGWLAVRTEDGEPHHAKLATGGIVLASLLLRNLNAVASLITMFFLITYVMINTVLLIEQSLDLVSFRPLLRLPRGVALAGTLGCLFVMFVINPTLSLLSLMIVTGIYVVLIQRHLDAPFEDVRSGLFVALAEWAATLVEDLPEAQERAWKPNLLVPISDARELRGTFMVLQDLCAPEGSVKIIGLNPSQASSRFQEQMRELVHSFRKRGVFAFWTEIKAAGFAEGLVAGMQALRGTFFKPNVVFLNISAPEGHEDDYRQIVREAENENLGAVLYAAHPTCGLGQRQRINVWIHDRSPDWELSMDMGGNLNLPLLAAYKLKQNWDATMHFVMVVDDPDDADQARSFLERLREEARMPQAEINIGTGDFDEYVHEAPLADLNIFGLLQDPDFDFAHRMVEETGATCLFVRDSGRESVLA